jgi:ADP-ribosyl-[dinitrogen reductase] hydrolase
MLTGGCLCGAVRFEIDGALGRITVVCHCSMCRRSSGSAFIPAASVDAARFRITGGGEILSAYKSSPEYERTFCSRCGSQLFGRHAAYPIVWVRLGALDEDPGSRPAVHIMTGSKAPWYTIADGAEQFAEWPPLHYFLPGSSRGGK